MPLYEFKCEECGASFELLLKSSTEDALCPHCKSSHLKRLLSRFGVGTKKGGGSGSSSCPSGTCPFAS